MVSANAPRGAGAVRGLDVFGEFQVGVLPCADFTLDGFGSAMCYTSSINPHQARNHDAVKKWQVWRWQIGLG